MGGRVNVTVQALGMAAASVTENESGASGTAQVEVVSYGLVLTRDTHGSGLGGLAHACRLAVAGLGNGYVVDAGNHRLWKSSPVGP